MVQTFYNEDMSIPELIEESTYQRELLELDRLSLMLEMATRREELNIREAEIRCMEESGDINLLDSYYMEASEESGEQKKNIFKRLWDAIRAFFTRISNFIKGSDKKEELQEMADNDEEIVVDEEGYNFFTAVKAFLSKLKQFIAHPINFFKDDDTTNGEKVLASLGLIAIAGSAVALGTVGARKIKAKEVNSTADELKNLSEEASKKDDESIFSLFKGKIPNCFKSVYAKISEWLKKASAKLLSFVPSRKKDNKSPINPKGRSKEEQYKIDHDTRSTEEKINSTRERLEPGKPEKGLFGRKKEPYSMKNWKDGKKMTISDMKKSSDKKLRELGEDLDSQVQTIVRNLQKQGYKKDSHGNILGKEIKPDQKSIGDFHRLEKKYPQLDLSSFQSLISRSERIIKGRQEYKEYHKESVGFMESTYINDIDVYQYIIENVEMSCSDIFVTDY